MMQTHIQSTVIVGHSSECQIFKTEVLRGEEIVSLNGLCWEKQPRYDFQTKLLVHPSHFFCPSQFFFLNFKVGIRKASDISKNIHMKGKAFPVDLSLDAWGSMTFSTKLTETR